jgi:hypothetical protein
VGVGVGCGRGTRGVSRPFLSLQLISCTEGVVEVQRYATASGNAVLGSGGKAERRLRPSEDFGLTGLLPELLATARFLAMAVRVENRLGARYRV